MSERQPGWLKPKASGLPAAGSEWVLDAYLDDGPASERELDALEALLGPLLGLAVAVELATDDLEFSS